MQEIKESLKRYVDHGIETGSFLRAVLENNLSEAFSRADYINQTRLHEIVRYVYNHLPANCWGSEEKVKNWLNKESSKFLECERCNRKNATVQERIDPYLFAIEGIEDSCTLCEDCFEKRELEI